LDSKTSRRLAGGATTTSGASSDDACGPEFSSCTAGQTKRLRDQLFQSQLQISDKAKKPGDMPGFAFYQRWTRGLLDLFVQRVPL
jgi:hypothetical protein